MLERKINSFTRRFWNAFLNGVLIIAPILVTVMIVIYLFNLISSYIPDFNILSRILQNFNINENAIFIIDKAINYIIVIGLITGLGFINHRFLFGGIISNYINRFVEKTPVLKFIYSSVKDLFGSFVGEKKKFDKTVLVKTSIEPEMWRLGFITVQDFNEFGLTDFTIVYLPHSFAWSGNMILVKSENIRMLPDLKSSDALKFAITAGTVDFRKDDVEKNEKELNSSTG